MSSTPLTVNRTLRGETQAWTFASPEAKLRWRASLPGASGWDEAAHVARVLQAKGTRGADLLALIFPTSWMVNAKATSRAFRRWLAPPARESWVALLDALDPMLSPEEWLALPESHRAEVAEIVATLAGGADGAGLAAVTKSLALLRPQLVPLMDDAALWFATEAVARPESADTPEAKPTQFVPMLDWFARAVCEAEGALVAVAANHENAVLDAAQVLDRLLWVESWGYRLTPPASRYWWVKDGAREAIVEVGPASFPPGEAVDLTRTDLDEAWKTRARSALVALADRGIEQI